MSAYAVRCVASPTMAPPHVANDTLRAPRGAAVGVSKAHAGEEEPRERLACVDGNPVDEIAVEEGDLLRGALAATVDAADLLCASCHPEEQPLGMAAGLTEATKDQALVGQGIQVSLQGTDLALSRSVVGDVDSVELGLGDVTELLGPDLDSLGASRPITVASELVHRLQEGQREPGHAIHPDPAAGPNSQYWALMTQTPHS